MSTEPLVFSVKARYRDSSRYKRAEFRIDEAGIHSSQDLLRIKWADISSYTYSAESTTFNLVPTGSSLEFSFKTKDGESIGWKVDTLLRVGQWKTVMSAIQIVVSTTYEQILNSYAVEMVENGYFIYPRMSEETMTSLHGMGADDIWHKFYNDGSIETAGKISHYSDRWKVYGGGDSDPFHVFIRDKTAGIWGKLIAEFHIHQDYFVIREVLRSLYKCKL